jgi:hypothetical protein
MLKTILKLKRRIGVWRLYWHRSELLESVGWGRVQILLALHDVLLEQGYINSALKGLPVDKLGGPIPWLTYPAIDFLHGRAKRNLSVFEFGCGQSTLWWSERVLSVHACEHDSLWLDRVRSRVGDNVTLLQYPLDYGGEYCRAAVNTGRRFNIVVIDGRDRVNAALQSTQALADDGIIVWDNTERSCYLDGQKQLNFQGFRQVDFRGLSPCASTISVTSVFYREGNCLGI